MQSLQEDSARKDAQIHELADRLQVSQDQNSKLASELAAIKLAISLKAADTEANEGSAEK